VIGAQRGQHVAVAGGVQDPLHDHVIAVIERVAGHRVDQADVHAAGNVTLA